MLREALELIQKTATQAKAPVIIRELDPTGRSAIVALDGQTTHIAIPPPPRTHTVRSLADLTEYCRRGATMPVVWHGEAQVVLVCDDQQRLDWVAFPLTYSQRFATLKNLAEEAEPMSQAALIRTLRIDLGLDNQRIVAQFRRLDWETGDKGISEARHGDTRLAKQVIAKVQGVDELPEELQIPTAVYQQAGERSEYTIRLVLEIDAVNRLFQITPAPDEIERVLDLAQASIHDRLTKALPGVPVYYGTL